MEIREATDADIPAIVDLLRLSLGEGLMPKSTEYWHWKHFENPFGPSPVLVCWEHSKLIGVRAFMRWEWIASGQQISAVRAVDTATHPDFQGKGVFRKLTMSLVETSKYNGLDIVFNTPNHQSKPGYLKMGWDEAGRLPVKFSLRKPARIVSNIFLKTRANNKEPNGHNLTRYLDHPGLENLLENAREKNTGIVTKVSRRYLIWRYRDVPVADYLALGSEQGIKLHGLLIGRIKLTKLGREFRITDAFVDGRNRESEREIQHQLQELLQEYDIDYCTISAAGLYDNSVLKKFSVKATVGPIVTIRSLKMQNLNEFIKFRNWSPSLGDLELF